MGQVHVSQEAYAHASNAGYPSGAPLVLTGEVDAGDPQIIVLSQSVTGQVAVGDLVRWDATGVAELRRVTDVQGSLVNTHWACTPGTGKSVRFGGDLSTIQAGLDAVAAMWSSGLLEAWISQVAAGVYAEQVNIGVAGTEAAVHQLVGVGEVVIDGTNTLTNCLTSSLVSTAIYWRFENLKFTRAVGHGANFATSQSNMTWVDCEAYANGFDGIDPGGHAKLLRCVSRANGRRGFGGGTSSVYLGCKAYGNGWDQFYGYGNTTYDRCIARAGGPGAYACFLGATTVANYYSHCVADGAGLAGVSGIAQTNTGGMDVADCIISRCAVGVKDFQDNGKRRLRANNLFWGNSFKYENWATDEGEIEADPRFVDPDGVVPDYSVRPGSPAIGAGLGGGDIGALQSNYGKRRGSARRLS